MPQRTPITNSKCEFSALVVPRRTFGPASVSTIRCARCASNLHTGRLRFSRLETLRLRSRHARQTRLPLVPLAARPHDSRQRTVRARRNELRGARNGAYGPWIAETRTIFRFDRARRYRRKLLRRRRDTLSGVRSRIAVSTSCRPPATAWNRRTLPRKRRRVPHVTRRRGKRTESRCKRLSANLFTREGSSFFRR
jgi:hypothetical protein